MYKPLNQTQPFKINLKVCNKVQKQETLQYRMNEIAEFYNNV